MTNKELQDLLKEYPDNIRVKQFIHGFSTGKDKERDFEKSDFSLHSNTAFADDMAPEEEWDLEDGKQILGDGEKYLLFNYPQY